MLETESGVMQPQAKECQQPLEGESGEEGVLPWSLQKKPPC